MARYYFLLTLAVLLVGLLPASPLAVSEPPDLPDSGGPTYSLGVGVNIIDGWVNGHPGGGDYQDNFSLFLPVNAMVTSVSVQITGFAYPGLGPFNLGCFTGAGCFATNGIFGLASPAAGSTTSYTATSPWGENPSGGVDIGTFQYTLMMVVEETHSAIPEPSAWLMLGSGLLALGFLRRV